MKNRSNRKKKANNDEAVTLLTNEIYDMKGRQRAINSEFYGELTDLKHQIQELQSLLPRNR